METEQTFARTAEMATLADIKAFETKIGVGLPEDYKAHLLRFNGGFPRRDTFLKGNDEFVVNKLFSIGSGNMTLDDARRLTASELHDDFVFFANEAGGDLFVMSVGLEDYGSVYYIAHESYKPPKRKEMSQPRQYGKGVYFLAPSFTEFLSGLVRVEVE
jgi:hypothetical protein